MKCLHGEVDVALRDEAPVRLHWEGRVVQVFEVINSWVIRGNWWGEEVCRCYMALQTDRGYLVVFHNEVNDTWHLARQQD